MFPTYISNVQCSVLQCTTYLFVCLYTKIVITAEPIGPKFCVGPHMTPGKVYESSKLLQNSIFIKFKKSTIFLIKSANYLFVFVLQYTQKENFTIKKEDGREAP